MKTSVQSILITESQIEKRVHELGRQISRDYDNSDLVLVCVLKGAILFFADLIRTLDVPARCEFVQLASYHNDTESSGVQMIQGLCQDLFRADVLIVEGIVDTGMTLDFLTNHIGSFEPTSVKVCSLLDKPERRQVPVAIDYLGFEIPNTFVVGYGLDYAQQYRNLPYIGVLDGDDLLP
jgi:hypoxanthine phosphoribosyltransferase